MILMALDHVRDFFHAEAMRFQPDDLTRTSALLFFTRWITHICAPVFVFTAGAGAFLWLRGGRTRGQLSRFLWTRGLWLVFLELSVLRLAMNFDLFNGVVLLSILWALGWSMIALGFLVHLPVRVLAVLSIAIIALHNLADPVQASRFGGGAWVWNILHQPGIFFRGDRASAGGLSASSMDVRDGGGLLLWIHCDFGGAGAEAHPAADRAESDDRVSPHPRH